MMYNFQNNQISTDQLPRVSSVDFIPLHTSYMQLVWLQSIVFSVFCIAISTIPLCYKYFNETYPLSYNLCYVVIGVGVLLSFIKTIVAVFGVPKKGYAIRELDLIYKTGLINRKTIVVPFNRVQHVALMEGFLLRIFSLTKLEFYTAGGSFSDLKITGISKDEAERIKAFVVNIIDKNQLDDAEIVLDDDTEVFAEKNTVADTQAELDSSIDSNLQADAAANSFTDKNTVADTKANAETKNDSNLGQESKADEF